MNRNQKNGTRAKEKRYMKTTMRESPLGSMLPGLLFVAAGAGLLTINLFNISLKIQLWPLFIIVAGLLMLFPAYQAAPDHASTAVVTMLAALGVLLVTIGLLLSVMEWINRYEGWAYAWTLLPAAVVAGRLYARRFELDSPERQTALRLIQLFLIAFAVLAILFEMLIFNGYGQWWPLLLILLGLYLLFQGRR
jgi:hypothetical protein